ncbi:hypothetical protein SAMN05421770_1199 [Granulicella rosea]|uniref:Uncharacterized protein n=1 Tax=Granulicella rosea TaxID=474952 RepID=A0A239MNT9_9BACT|nr:hypothetical protein [Granulicella rosea]SNT44381.1 hypothetical protein SAMN05421770_1199 [Granulicella rosea]
MHKSVPFAFLFVCYASFACAQTTTSSQFVYVNPSGGYSTQYPDALWQQSDGNLGVGTSTPRAQLEVNGDVIAGGVYNNDHTFFGGQHLAFNFDYRYASVAANNYGIFNSSGYAFDFVHNDAGTGPLSTDDNLSLTVLTPQSAGPAIADTAIKIIAGNLYTGFGTDDPHASVHIGSPMVSLQYQNQTPFGFQNATGAGNLLIQSFGPRSMAFGSALTFANDGGVNGGGNYWETGRVMTAGDDNVDNGTGRMYLQTRAWNPTLGYWDWNSNLVLAANGSVGINMGLIGNSTIVDQTPTQALDVNGGVRIRGSQGLTFPDGSVQTTAAPLTQLNGNVGIGTTNPQAALEVAGFSQATGPGNGVGITLHNTSGEPQGGSITRILFEGGSVGDDKGVQPFAMIQGGGTDYDSNNGFLGFQTAQSGALAEQMRIMPNGNVGLGTANPGAKLEVNGNTQMDGSLTFKDAGGNLTVQSTAWNGTTLGGDYAESIDVLGDRKTYQPGDVITMDESAPGKFTKSQKPYSKLVSGVFSTKPGLTGRRVNYERPDKEAEVPMAMMGIVPTKVSTENGAIAVGDLLVSASIPGYAMKGTDRERMMGAIIGKALAPLGSGSGIIEVLVSLQ